MLKPVEIKISIVIFDAEIDEVFECLSSLMAAIDVLDLAQRGRASGRVILINNSYHRLISPDMFEELPKAFGERNFGLDIIQGHGNIGYGSGHNLTINAEYRFQHQYHIFMNSDVILDENALLEGITMLEAEQRYAMISPSAVNMSDEKQYLCKRQPSLLIFLLRGLRLDWINSIFKNRIAAYEMRDLSESITSEGILIASGCFMFCRSSAVAQIEGFDERFFLYFEDFDFSLRLRKVGEIVYAPSVKIKHFGGNASRKGAQHFIYFCTSALKFFRKHGWKWV